MLYGIPRLGRQPHVMIVEVGHLLQHDQEVSVGVDIAIDCDAAEREGRALMTVRMWLRIRSCPPRRTRWSCCAIERTSKHSAKLNIPGSLYFSGPNPNLARHYIGQPLAPCILHMRRTCAYSGELRVCLVRQKAEISHCVPRPSVVHQGPHRVLLTLTLGFSTLRLLPDT